MVGTIITASAAGCETVQVTTTHVTNGNANGYYRSFFFSSDIHTLSRSRNRNKNQQEQNTGTLHIVAATLAGETALLQGQELLLLQDESVLLQ
jgi:hypothetical protein